jgi:hypothetical protein
MINGGAMIDVLLYARGESSSVLIRKGCTAWHLMLMYASDSGFQATTLMAFGGENEETPLSLGHTLVDGMAIYIMVYEEKCEFELHSLCASPTPMLHSTNGNTVYLHDVTGRSPFSSAPLSTSAMPIADRLTPLEVDYMDLSSSYMAVFGHGDRFQCSDLNLMNNLKYCSSGRIFFPSDVDGTFGPDSFACLGLGYVNNDGYVELDIFLPALKKMPYSVDRTFTFQIEVSQTTIDRWDITITYDIESADSSSGGSAESHVASGDFDGNGDGDGDVYPACLKYKANCWGTSPEMIWLLGLGGKVSVTHDRHWTEFM